MRINWEKHAPVGLDGGQEAKTILVGLIVASLWGIFDFAGAYTNALSNLYYRYAGLKSTLIPDAVMEDFSVLILGSDFLFDLICLAMPLLAVWHYVYHYRDSRSVYLMRRLPDRWEFHRRCLMIPMGGLVASLSCLGVLGIAFYLIYILCTPQQCLPV